jgi:beta-glucosidase
MRTVVFLFVFIWNISNILTAPPPLPSYDKQVNALLANMTDEEKVGQMVQIAINLIVKDTSKPWYEIEVDPVKLATAIQDYKVGSILNVVPGAYGIEQWHDIIGQIQDEAQKTRLSIPIIYGIDSIHGANYVQNSVLFPHATGLAATFNTSLVRAIGKISAHQTRAAALPWVFHPQVDIGYVILRQFLTIHLSLVVKNYGHVYGKPMVRM